MCDTVSVLLKRTSVCPIPDTLTSCCYLGNPQLQDVFHMLDIFALMGGNVFIANNSQLCFSSTQNLLYWGPRTGSYLEYDLDAVRL